MNKKSILKNQIEQLAGVESVELVCVEPETLDHAVFHVYFDPESVVDRLTPEEVALRNYNATVKRGLINDKTTIMDFIKKIKEEQKELKRSYSIFKLKALTLKYKILFLFKRLFKSKKTELPFDSSELADISLVCDAMAIHYGIDLMAEKQAKMYINETRKD